MADLQRILINAKAEGNNQHHDAGDALIAAVGVPWLQLRVALERSIIEKDSMKLSDLFGIKLKRNVEIELPTNGYYYSTDETLLLPCLNSGQDAFLEAFDSVSVDCSSRFQMIRSRLQWDVMIIGTS